MDTCAVAFFTFSLGPEDEGPQGGDHLELVVAQSSHLPDGAGQDHSLGVHLLSRGGGGGDESVKGPASSFTSGWSSATA